MPRKLVLQMQLSVDGFVCGPKGEMNWVNMDWGADINAFVTELTLQADSIVKGRVLAEGFITHWQSVADSAEDEFSKLMDSYRKVVFSRHANALQKRLPQLGWRNTEIAQGTLQEELLRLKNSAGKDIMCYGGAEFVSALIQENLIDDYYLFINPSAIGQGMGIFSKLKNNRILQLEFAKSFDCGIVVIKYRKS